MIEWVVAAAISAAAGAGFWGLSRRKKGHSEWSALLEETALRLGGRASVAGAFDSPELRAVVKDLQVTLRLSAALSEERQVDATSDVALPQQGAQRIFFGWNVETAPTDWQHVPEVPTGALRLEGHWQLRSDVPDLALVFVRQAELFLTDLARETEAQSISVACRGGYLHVLVVGCRKTSSMLERVVVVTAELARIASPTEVSET